ncbi:MAG: hypothetical protein K6E17_02455 [Clostridiales bacterium]|nr:hypothetical protein [Clostridiales bacterium]
MTPNQRSWSRERDRLASALDLLGWPEELADLLAKQLGSPQAVRRMASWVAQARPESLEMIVDEMLAIRDEIDSWRSVKESREAQAGYSAWLSSTARLGNEEEDDGS